MFISRSDTVTFKNTIISNNNAGDYGGGIYMADAVVTFEDSTIDNNQATNTGGAMRMVDGDVTMKNTILSNKQMLVLEAPSGYGASTTATFRQTTFIDNNN